MLSSAPLVFDAGLLYQATNLALYVTALDVNSEGSEMLALRHAHSRELGADYRFSIISCHFP